MKKYDIYLFDFDGTLLNTMPALEYVFREAFKEIGIEYNPEDTVEFSRVPLTVSFAKMNGKKEDWTRFVNCIDDSLDSKEALHSNVPYEETLEFFRLLKKNKIIAGIATSNNKKHVEEVFEVLGVDQDIFTVVIGNKECDHFKPHPDPILKALEALNYQGELSEVAYIGDAMNDTLAANAAGVQAILIDREKAFPESDKYIKIDNLLELFK